MWLRLEGRHHGGAMRVKNGAAAVVLVAGVERAMSNIEYTPPICVGKHVAGLGDKEEC